jgi:hypothetical protein
MEYAIAVWLVSDKQVYLCRRIDAKLFHGKWQPVWRELAVAELPMAGACKAVEEQTGIVITESRLHWAQTLNNEKITSMCWVYLVHLKNDELPRAPLDNDLTDWVLVRLDKATILDLVPGFRVVALKLLKALKNLKKTTIKM